jgi:phosphoglycolate phosphatase
VIDLVVFDMAGTTIDDHGLVYVALEQSVVEAGATVAQADLQTWMGTDKVRAISALLPLGGVDADPQLVNEVFARFRLNLEQSYARRPPVALPGVEEALREFRRRGIKTSLTTGFSDDVAQPLLSSLGWRIGNAPDDLLDAVVTTSDVAAGRPSPYLIHHAMERTGVCDVRRVLAAGDTIVDVQAAYNAGVIAVGVLTGGLVTSDFDDQPCDFVLDSVVDVLALIDDLDRFDVRPGQ